MRPRLSSLPRSPVSEAVRQLRLHLGLTQQLFAVKLGTALATIARYETDRTPRGKILIEFNRLAEQAGRKDLAQIFSRAAYDQLGITLGLKVGLRRERARVGKLVHDAEVRLRALCAGFHRSDLSKEELAALGTTVESVMLAEFAKIGGGDS